MINEGGVASQTSYVGTHIHKHTTSGIYILITDQLESTFKDGLNKTVSSKFRKRTHIF